MPNGFLPQLTCDHAHGSRPCGCGRGRGHGRDHRLSCGCGRVTWDEKKHQAHTSRVKGFIILCMFQTMNGMDGCSVWRLALVGCTANGNGGGGGAAGEQILPGAAPLFARIFLFPFVRVLRIVTA